MVLVSQRNKEVLREAYEQFDGCYQSALAIHATYLQGEVTEEAPRAAWRLAAEVWVLLRHLEEAQEDIEHLEELGGLLGQFQEAITTLQGEPAGEVYRQTLQLRERILLVIGEIQSWQDSITNS